MTNGRSENGIRQRDAEALSQAADVSWLHHVYGLSQAEIAERRGLSRMKVHRLIQLAYDSGMVRVFVDAVPNHCAELETELIRRFGLTSCTVVPDPGPTPDMFSAMHAVATAAAMVLFGRLESTEARTIGLGSGRTMAAIARALPPLRRPETSFVSLTGDFAALNDANPFEVIHTLVAKTGGKGHAFTAPLIVESREDRDLFLRQRGVAHVMGLVRGADFLFTGLGHVGPNSFFDDYSLVTADEIAQVRARDVVADLTGHLIDSQGRFVDDGLPERMLAIDRAELYRHPLIVAAGGMEKWPAMLAALRSNCVDGVITNAGVARHVMDNA